MATILTITSNPQTFSAGTYGAAATVLNTGKWRFTFTPTAASSTFTGGNFHSLLAQDHGGIWLNDANLELYTAPGDAVAFSQALTWSAGQTVTVTVDTRSGSRSVTVAGATTGNGTFSFATAGPYFDGSLPLFVGQYSGPPLTFTGTVGSVDDVLGGGTLAAASGTFTLAGQAAALKRTYKLPAASGSFALTGTAATLTKTSGAHIVALAGAFVLTGQAATLKQTHRLLAASGTFALTGSAATLQAGTPLSIGSHGIDFQPFPYSDRDAVVTIDTQTAGSIVLVSGGGRSADLTLGWTENNGNSIRKLTAVLDYPDFGGYGTQVGVTKNAMAGRSGHAFTVQVANEDESTIFATEVIGAKRVSFIHASFNDVSPGTTVSIGPLVTDGPAVLLAYWYGASPVNPPFTGTSGPHGTGVGTPFTAVPNNSFVVLDANLNNFQNGEVQAVVAAKAVSSAGSYSVTWTHSPAQGAELWLVAAQAAARLVADPGSFALTGSSANLTKVNRFVMAAASGSFALAGQAAGLRAGRRIGATSGAFVLAGSAAALRAARRVAASSGAFALTGSAAVLINGRHLAALSGSFAVSGSAAALRATRRLAAASGAFVVTGSDAALSRAGAVVLAASSGTFSLTGTAAALRAARRLLAASGGFTLVGSPAALVRANTRTLIASSGAFTLQGGAVALRASRWLSASAGVYVLTGSPATLEAGVVVAPLPGWGVAFEDLVRDTDRLAQQRLGGEPIIYRSAIGSLLAPAPIAGIFDEVYVLAKGDPLAGVETVGPAVFLRLEDLPVDPELDDPTLVIRGVVYRVVERRPDGIGGIVLALRRVT